MFKTQTRDLLMRLNAMPADAASLVHTLKGSARAIGAFEVGDAAHHLETAMLANSNMAEALHELSSAIDNASAAIDVILTDLKS